MTKALTLDRNVLCVRTPRDSFEDEMQELMASAMLTTCILTDVDTTKVEGAVVCTTHSHKISNRLWRLAEMKTEPKWRSKGIGAAHLKALVEKLKSSRKRAVGLFFEIPSRSEAGIKAKELAVRQRRARFYERLGAVTFPGVVLIPRSRFGGPPDTGAELVQVELMWIPLNGTVTDKDVSDVLRYLVTAVGDTPEGHSLIEQVVTQNFGDKLPRKLAAK